MNNFLEKLSRIIAAAGFSILSGLSGIGLAWIVVYHRSDADKYVTESMPKLVAGGAVGLVIGIIISIIFLKMDPRREAQIENRYVGIDGSLKIYGGVPAFVMVLLAPLLCRLDQIVGQNTDIWVNLGVGLVVLALCLIVREHIPQRLVVPLGTIGWLLTLAFVVWFFIFGPGAFGHAKMRYAGKHQDASMFVSLIDNPYPICK